MTFADCLALIGSQIGVYCEDVDAFKIAELVAVRGLDDAVVKVDGHEFVVSCDAVCHVDQLPDETLAEFEITPGTGPSVFDSSEAGIIDIDAKQLEDELPLEGVDWNDDEEF